MTDRTNPARRPMGWILWVTLAAVAIAGAALAARHRARRARAASQAVPVYEAAQGPLTISLTQSGTIQSREKVIIRCEVEGRNTVISLVPEGKVVKKGELLVEIDSSELEENRIEQQIRLESVRSAMIQARENMDVVSNTAIADVDEAELNLRFAHLEQEKFSEAEYLQQLQQADADIKIASVELKRANDKLEWSERLATPGYLTRTELDADRLAAQKCALDLELAKNKMLVLTNYTYTQTVEKNASNIRKAERELARLKRKGESSLIQAESDLLAKESEFERQKQKLDRLVEQIGKCKITAPADGMVVYATTVSERRWNQEPLQVGNQVFERQDLIYLPATAEMMAIVQIPEASLPKLRVGLPATVRVDALPGRVLQGHLAKIGFLPNSGQSWLNPDLKVYDSEIHLVDGSGDLRPGMNCRVEMMIDQYDDAVYVPVQCVLRVQGQSTVYVMENGRPVPRSVEAGLDNNRMIRIVSGLRRGEKVLLAPPLPPSTLPEGGPVEPPTNAVPAAPAVPREPSPAEAPRPPRRSRPDAPATPRAPAA